MSTLYFHIPFCKKACHYCDFHFSTVHKTYDDVINAIQRELALQSDFLPNKKLTSIYFGGGTPSLLKADDLKKLLAQTHHQFEVAPDAEITLEANPDDLSIAKLRAIRQSGVNRLSIGIQSFFDEDLKAMNRSHEAHQALKCVSQAQDLGFENITIDLIFGLPNLSNGKWQTNIEKALELNVPHISAYSLTVEPNTALHKMVNTGRVHLPTEDDVLAQYQILTTLTRENGFDHYELSNYGKPGFHSRHNSSYWAGDPYLGIGPSAHGFNGHLRQWNVANNTQYVKKISAGETWFERETIDQKDAFNEFVMTGLRTANGVSLDEVEKRFRREGALLDDAQAKLECGKLELRNGTLIIPENEWMMSDSIISDLFWVDD